MLDLNKQWQRRIDYGGIKRTNTNIPSVERTDCIRSGDRSRMTYERAIRTGKPFNREVYKDGWYQLDHRGLVCSVRDLSIRYFSAEDKEWDDWRVQEDPNDENPWKPYDAKTTSEVPGGSGTKD